MALFHSQPHAPQRQLRPAVLRGLAVAAPALLFAVAAVVVAGCSFDNTLDERRCLNNAACESRLGEGWVCYRQYCHSRACDSDEACQGRFGDGWTCAQQTCLELAEEVCDSDATCQSRDGFLCNGRETCAPDDEAADAFGCVAGDPAAVVDDGVECTVDLCDESRPANQKVIHDPAGCECQGDAICAQLNNDPCVEAACDTTTFTCTLTPLADQTTCEDGLTCTVGTVCIGGACVLPDEGGVRDDAACQDGSFCNGAEVCDPEAEGANAVTGCVAGTPPTADPTIDDGIACTIAACSEGGSENQGSVIHDPRGCECAVPEDCRQAAGTCQVFKCDADNGFTCEVVPDEFVDQGAGCDDGVECTSQDSCTDQGLCEGQRVDLYCQNVAGCTDGQTARCMPGAVGADETTGCVCQ